MSILFERQPNPTIFSAVKARDREALLSVVEPQVRAGVDALEINLGVCRQASEKWLPWTIEEIRRISNLPLFMTAAEEALAQGLKAAGDGCWINGVTADTARLESRMAAAECFNAGIVVMLIRDGFMPATAEEMALLAEDVLELIEKRGFPLYKVILDPVLRPRGDLSGAILAGAVPDVTQLMDAIAIISRLREEGVRTLVGLSNISLGLSMDYRSSIHQKVLTMLDLAGLDTVILNRADDALMKLALSMKGNDEGISSMEAAFVHPELSA